MVKKIGHFVAMQDDDVDLPTDGHHHHFPALLDLTTAEKTYLIWLFISFRFFGAQKKYPYNQKKLP